MKFTFFEILWLYDFLAIWMYFCMSVLNWNWYISFFLRRWENLSLQQDWSVFNSILARVYLIWVLGSLCQNGLPTKAETGRWNVTSGETSANEFDWWRLGHFFEFASDSELQRSGASGQWENNLRLLRFNLYQRVQGSPEVQSGSSRKMSIFGSITAPTVETVNISTEHREVKLLFTKICYCYQHLWPCLYYCLHINKNGRVCSEFSLSKMTLFQGAYSYAGHQKRQYEFILQET